MAELALKGTSPPVIRFGVFEADLRSAELFKNGRRIKLEGQPFQILALLLERPGQLITRGELQKALWPADTFVDFEPSINAAVRRLRDALGDAAESPRFIQTLPRRGYRFIGSIDPIAPLQTPAPPTPQREAPPAQRRLPIRSTLVVLIAIAAVVIVTNVGGLRERLFGSSLVSLAVLPVGTPPGGDELDALISGLTDSLITTLKAVDSRRLQVRPYSTAWLFKNSDLPLRDIARKLDVDAVLQSSLTRVGDRSRLTVSLVWAAGWKSAWTRTHEDTLPNAMRLLAHDASRQLLGDISAEQEVRLAPADIDPRAFEAFLGGLGYFRTGTNASRKMADEKFQRAIEIAPAWANPYGYMALLLSHGGITRGGGKLKDRQESREWARKALARDVRSAEAYAALAWAAMTDWNWPDAEDNFRLAIQANPDFALAHMWYSQYLSAIHRPDEACAEADVAIRLEPDEPATVLHAAMAYYHKGDIEKATGHWRGIVRKAPRYWPARNHLARAAIRHGQFALAIRELDEIDPDQRDDQVNLAVRAHAYAKADRREEAEAIMAFLESRENPRTPHVFLAIGYAGYNPEKTLEELEKGHEKKGEGIVFMDAEYLFDSVRDAPRFRAMLDAMKFPPAR